jgi:hypothetical protein
MTNLVIIPGVPFRDYPKPPEDQPGCEKVECPDCHELMWISKKKRAFIKLNKANHLSVCWHCIKQRASNGEFGDEFPPKLDI